MKTFILLYTRSPIKIIFGYNILLIVILYSKNYSNNAYCTYIVSVPMGSYIKLTLLQVEIHCLLPDLDFLEMRDGDSEEAPLMIKFCEKKNHVPTEMTTSQNFFWMRFVVEF